MPVTPAATHPFRPGDVRLLEHKKWLATLPLTIPYSHPFSRLDPSTLENREIALPVPPGRKTPIVVRVERPYPPYTDISPTKDQWWLCTIVNLTRWHFGKADWLPVGHELAVLEDELRRGKRV